MTWLAYQTDCLAKDTRERVKDLHCRVKTIDQSPITLAIFFKCLPPFLEQLKDILRRV